MTIDKQVYMHNIRCCENKITFMVKTISIPYRQAKLLFRLLAMSFLHAACSYSCMFHFHFPQLDVVIHLPLLMAILTTLIVHKKE